MKWNSWYNIAARWITTFTLLGLAGVLAYYERNYVAALLSVTALLFYIAWWYCARKAHELMDISRELMNRNKELVNIAREKQ